MKLTKILCMILYFFFLSAESMESPSLKMALAGKEKMQVITLIRCSSSENMLVLPTERQLIYDTLQGLFTSNTEHFSKTIRTNVSSDIQKYQNLLVDIGNSREKAKKEILKSKLINKFKGIKNFPIDDGDFINGLTNLLFQNETCEKKIFKAFCANQNTKKEKFSDTAWTAIAGTAKTFQKSKFYLCPDPAIAEFLFAPEDYALYQKMKEKKDEAKMGDLETFLHNQYTNQAKKICEQITKIIGLKIFQANVISMLVCNEYFFGQCLFPVEIIKNEISNLSKICKSVLFCTNFLCYDNNEVDCAKIQAFTPKIKDLIQTRLMMNEDQYRQWISKYHNNQLKVFQNISTIFLNGKLQTFYKKGSYAAEANSLIPKGYFYEFGNGKDGSDSDDPIHKHILDNISTEICLDLSDSVRKDDIGQQRFHIFQSNTHKFNSPITPQFVKYIVHADFGSPGVIYKKPLTFHTQGANTRPIPWNSIGDPKFNFVFLIGNDSYILSCFDILPE